MLGDKAWLAVGVPIHPKCVRWGWGQGSVQANQFIPHWSWQTLSLWTSLCARGHCHPETGKGLPQNCCQKVGSTESSRMSLCAVALRFIFTGNKGPSPNHEKQSQTIIPPPPNFTVDNVYSPGIRQTQTVIVLKLLPEAVWNSVLSVATEDRRFLRAMHFSTRQTRSVSFCGLTLHG